MGEAWEVQQVLARYVRATDSRNGAAMAALFMENGKVEIYQSQAQPVLIGELAGAQAIGQAVGSMMAPHPERGWSHHTTHDPIIEINGEEATIDAQFIVYTTVGHARPAEGWPAHATGSQGTITPIEAGYYRASLARLNGVWKIAQHRIILDLPMAWAQV